MNDDQPTSNPAPDGGGLPPTTPPAEPPATPSVPPPAGPDMPSTPTAPADEPGVGGNPPVAPVQ